MATLANSSMHSLVVTSQLIQAVEDLFEKIRILDLLLCCKEAQGMIIVDQKEAKEDRINKSTVHGLNEDYRMLAEVVEGIQS